MGEVVPLPRLGGVVRDVRGAGRALRVSWHADADGLVVLSLWDGGRCTGTVRVATADVPTLIEALQIGLRPPEPIASAPPTAGPVPAGPPAAGPVPAGPPAAGPLPAGPLPAGPRTGLDILEGPGGSATG